jgi:adenine-specific DNA methylase
MFSSRQLLGLSILYDKIGTVTDANTREFLLLAFSDALANNNMFCYYAFDYRKLTPIFGLHAYRPVQRSVEVNLLKTVRVRGSFPRCVEKVIRGKRYCYHPFEYLIRRDGRGKQVFTGERIVTSVSMDHKEWEEGLTRCLLMNKSSEGMSELSDRSVDLILTDPPYYDNIPYAEYSDFFYVWLRDHIHPLGRPLKTQHVSSIESLYVNPHAKNMDLEQRRFIDGMTNVFRECRRVLKFNGLMAFTYHHISNAAWETLCHALCDAGLYVVKVIPVRSEGKSGFHSYGGSLKWDAVIMCRVRLSHTRIVGSSRPGKVLRWAGTRLRRWASRAQALEMSDADRESLLKALACARLTQTNASPSEINAVYQRLRSFSERRTDRSRRSMKEIELAVPS